MFQLRDKPQPVWQIIKDGFFLWWTSSPRVLPIAAVCILVSALPIFIFPGLNTLNVHQFAGTLESYWYVLLPFYILGLFTFMTIFTEVYSYAVGHPKNIPSLLRRVSQRFLPALAAFIISSIILFFSMFLFFPAIILATFMVLYVPLVLIENLDPIHALKRSFHLVLNQWWHTFATFFFLLFIYFLVQTIIFRVVSPVGNIHFASGDQIWVLNNICQILWMIVSYPFMSATMVVLWHDLKLRHPEDLVGKRKVELTI